MYDRANGMTDLGGKCTSGIHAGPHASSVRSRGRAEAHIHGWELGKITYQLNLGKVLGMIQHNSIHGMNVKTTLK